MDSINYVELIKLALAARENAYVPYSNYKVGAALLAVSGKVYCGCNVENASYGASLCAERSAIAQAVSAGEIHFSAIAVCVFSDNNEDENAQDVHNYAFPCGICRQVLNEFCAADMPVVIARNERNYRLSSMSALLPEAFGPLNLSS